MKRAWMFTALLLLALVSGVMAQDDNAPPLEPFTDERFGLQGLRPEGWGSAGPGVYARNTAAAAGDNTILAIQSAPASVDQVWPALLRQLALSEIPESTGEYTTDAFTFTLYEINVSQGALNLQIGLALAESEGQTVAILLQASPDDYDALYNSLLLPVLDSLAPLEEEVVEVPYRVEAVTFTNGDITLAGTLTLPEADGAHPAVVLMTGSGPQTRDEEVVTGFPIFELIADYLTRQGIAVLRYDDRGVGESEGDWIETGLMEFTADGQAAVDYLLTRDDINSEQVGLLGHSEGGAYALIIAANPDSEVAFVILMAGPARSGRDVLLRQNEVIFQQVGATPEQLESQLNLLQTLFPLLEQRDYVGVTQAAYDAALADWERFTPEERRQTGFADGDAYATAVADTFTQQAANEPFASFLDYDPAGDIGQISVPVLAIFGGLDVQVDAEANTAALEDAIADAPTDDVTIITLPDANHLFQSAETGSINEYTTLPLEFTPDFLPTIGDWLLARVEVVE